jgi:hypothetical protein
MKNKKKKKKLLKDIIKATREKQRNEEIELYGKTINHSKIAKSKKQYSRKNYKIKIGD